MTQYKRIGIDTSKAVFTLHGIDEQDRLAEEWLDDYECKSAATSK